MSDEQPVGIGRRASLLSGLKVVDLTHFLAGPFGSMVLADMGADVLKVEQITGDSTRRTPPYFFEGDSAYFLSVNRNKRSIALNLRAAEGRAVLLRIVAEADIILDNMRSEQRERLGLTFEDLKEVNPRIISCSINGFGSDGPYNRRPAYDIIVEALSGVMSLTGPVGGPSVRAGVPIGDITAGLYAAIAALGGLEHLRRTGQGQHIDVSMLDSQISLLSYLAQYHLTGGLVPTHQGRAHVSIPTYNTFATKDGSEIVIAANTQEMWRALCVALGRPDLVDDPRFGTGADRLVHQGELLPILQGEFMKWTAEELDRALVDAEVPVAPINGVDVALANVQVRHRNMVVKVRHRSGKDFLTVGTPLKPDDAHGEEFSSPPALGADTASVLMSLGYTKDDVSELARDGIVGLVDG
ncbi:CaiB/BaiF CoA transferase family protein [Microbacterium rhizomatis]|uniref:CaiB/BaiF CoA transferase family protein n=1 Tax=Microbacterium rhizomatis TaxID=1631477 RepID=UPI0014784D05|nr:CoA transferase [Microbacterium rhizomatis]